MSDPYRLPEFRDATTGRKIRLRSGYYTVLSERGGEHTHAANWPDLRSARRCAQGLVGLPGVDRLLVVKPAGVLDDDDFMEVFS